MDRISTRARLSAPTRTGLFGIGVALAAVVANSPPTCADDAPRQVLSAGIAEVRVEPWPRGVRIAAGGVPVSLGSGLVVRRAADSDPVATLPDADAVRNAQREEFAGGVRLRLAYRDPAGLLSGDEVISVHADGRVERELTLRGARADTELLVEYLAAALHPPLIVGRPLNAAASDGQDVVTPMPVVPTREESADAALAHGFSRLEFDARIGPLRIDVQSDRPLTLYDQRGRPEADAARPLFWLGDPGSPLPHDGALAYRVAFQLPATAGRVETLPATRSNSTVRELADAQTWPAETPTIVPRPKLITWGTGGFALPEPLPARLFEARAPAADAPDATAATRLPAAADFIDARRASTELARFIGERFGIGMSATFTAAAGLIAVRPPAEAEFPVEGYRLRVDEHACVIEARSESGLLHAVQTLKQLLTRRADGQALIRAVDIYDWPTLSFRGAILPAGGGGPTLHLKLLRDVMAATKMNRLVLVADYVKWDAAPELHHAEWGMSKDEVRQILDAARALDVEVTPMIHTLTRAAWMFANDQHSDLAEDPAMRDVLCATHPGADPFLAPIVQEAVELFAPPALHVGGADYLRRARETWRASTREHDAGEIWLQHVQRRYDQLKQRGVRTLLWGDALLAPSEALDGAEARSADEAAKRRAALPADVIIVDRQTRAAPPTAYTSLAVLGRGGREVIAAAGSAPANIVSLAKAAFASKALGLLLTTSTAPSLDAQNFDRDLTRYAALALAAEAAWNADVPVNPERFLQGAHFAELSGLSTLRPAIRPGWTASIGGVANFPLGARTGGGWFGLGGRHDLSGLPHGLARFHGVMFDIARTSLGNVPLGLALASKLDHGVKLPVEAQIDLGQRAATLVFLQTTNFVCEPETLIGSYEIRFADARPPEKIELRYGRNILAYTDLAAAPESPILWTGSTPGNQRIALRGLVWNNPHRAAPIASIVFRCAEAEAAPILIGLTGLDDEALTPRSRTSE
ncbi:MAG: glycoside hydrolase family 20 zincin-like fold domain-containing protein [Phycisphaerae bacterium]